MLCLAAAVAVVGFFAHKPGGQLGVIFAVCCLLYLITPAPAATVTSTKVPRNSMMSQIRKGRCRRVSFRTG